MSSFSPEAAFQLRVNPLTGESEWVVVEAADEHDGTGMSGPGKSFLATTSYLDMLNDSRRNIAFHRAIRKTITRPCHVLDIGAGTGLLSMMAAKAMEDCSSHDGNKGMVSACESYLPMGKLMRRVLQANRMQTKIKILHKRSDELRVGADLPCRAEVMVSEILDSELLGEGLIPTLQHAHDFLLVEHPQTVPYRATIYGQLIESACLHKLHDLHSSENSTSDGVRLAPRGLENIVSTRHKQYAMHCDALYKEMKLLSEPFKVFEFDFWRKLESHREINICVEATNDGTIHAVISWWVLQLDEEGSIFYSTAPNWVDSFSFPEEERLLNKNNKNWCDHWRQCVWFTQGTGVPASNNELISFQAAHDEISVSYKFEIGTQATGSIRSVLGTVDNQLILCPEKIGMYGDKDWRSCFLSALENVFQKKSCPVCVVADDSVFLSISAARLSKDSQIFTMLPGLRDMGSTYLKAVSHFNSISEDQIRVIGKKAACLTMDNLCSRKVNLLLAEPFYCGSEGMLPWHALRYWKERTLLDSLLSEGAIIIPSRGILKACAMSLPDLWNSRRALGEIEGFDHAAANDVLGGCGDLSPCLPCSIWQCGETEELSDASAVMEFNLVDCIRPCSGEIEIKFARGGLCHGFALWIDWVLDEENSISVSTGPGTRHWKQGVKLLSRPVAVNAGESCSASLKASLDPSNGELSVSCSLSNAQWCCRRC